jgi:hypothetical protein
MASVSETGGCFLAPQAGVGFLERLAKKEQFIEPIGFQKSRRQSRRRFCKMKIPSNGGKPSV